MNKPERTNYQKKVISRYYENLDTITLTTLQELVTELYLAETAAQKERLWKRVEKAVAKLKVAPAIVQHLLEQRDPRLLAEHINDWLTQSR